ncbi:hypothetical protein [Cryptosporangium sp. NPDC048952]|uniref:hypothetical protein n=1 Tax=Cryptosporangium sp. NPDC048952 TaxID=3363961 RepID=UPI003722F4B5
MKILLGIALLILAALAVRWLITARRQNVVAEAHAETEVLGPHLPLRSSGQVSRALRANGYTEVRRPDQEPEPGSGPMLRP